MPRDLDRFAPYPIMALGSEVVVEYHWQTANGMENVIAALDPTTGDRRIMPRQTRGDGADPLADDLSV